MKTSFKKSSACRHGNNLRTTTLGESMKHFLLLDGKVKATPGSRWLKQPWLTLISVVHLVDQSGNDGARSVQASDSAWTMIVGDYGIFISALWQTSGLPGKLDLRAGSVSSSQLRFSPQTLQGHPEVNTTYPLLRRNKLRSQLGPVNLHPCWAASAGFIRTEPLKPPAGSARPEWRVRRRSTHRVFVSVWWHISASCSSKNTTGCMSDGRFLLSDRLPSLEMTQQNHGVTDWAPEHGEQFSSWRRTFQVQPCLFFWNFAGTFQVPSLKLFITSPDTFLDRRRYFDKTYIQFAGYFNRVMQVLIGTFWFFPRKSKELTGYFDKQCLYFKYDRHVFKQCTEMHTGETGATTQYLKEKPTYTQLKKIKGALKYHI